VRNRFKMSQQKDEKKRARAPNFSPDEKVALLNLIKKYSHIIENKKTDAVTWQDKSKALGEIIKKEIGTIQEIPFREDFPCHSTWKRCKHSGHFSRFRNIIGNFCIIKQKCLCNYVINILIQLVILQRSEQLQIKMIEETERKLTIQRRREEELHQFEIRK
jgi:hypothetical protein